MEDFINELNSAQREAVVNYQGPALVIAGAGSGKTRVLTYRIANLLSNGVRPYRILALTFTNKAASEMKERIAALVSPEQAQALWMGTFHSVFARILRREGEHLGFPSDYTIYDTIDSRSLVKSIIREMNLDDSIYKPNEVFGRISSAKNNLVTPDAYMASSELKMKDAMSRRPQLGEVYMRYVKRCQRFGAMDFDDLLLNTNILFRDFPDVLKKYQEAFDYILVDEYQDTNYSQYLIIKKLAERHQNLCVVGDDAQSIYSFRGARIENILNFKSDYPSHRIFKLEQNYRSTQNIVKAANSLISKNKDQIAKELFSKNDEGDKIEVVRCRDDREEGILVASRISEINLSKHDPYKEFAILYRTNAQSRIFEESLRKLNIPYRVFGSLSFYQRKEIKDLLAYFRVTVNPSDDESMKRIINYPLRGIGKTTIDKIIMYAEKLNTSMWDVLEHLHQINLEFNAGTLGKLTAFTAMINGFRASLKTMEAFDLAYTIASTSGVIADLKSEKTPEGISRWENVEELLNGIKDFTDNNRETEEATLAEYLQDVTLMTDADTDEDEDRNKVSVMTVHAAKGLEFSHVFIAGMEEELFPSGMNNADPKALEEERRLFYVALTRAMSTATITYAATRYKWGLQTSASPSRFIKEIDKNYLVLPRDFLPQSPFTEEERPKEQGYRPPHFDQPKRPSPPPQAVAGHRKLVHMERAERSTAASGTAVSPGSLRVGSRVEHDRFGIGTVEALEGSEPNVKATVNFPIGKKQLLLKFAHLRIITP
ncbi:MAG: ATP-dependent helicase [Bacteroidota bacterium]